MKIAFMPIDYGIFSAYLNSSRQQHKQISNYSLNIQSRHQKPRIIPENYATNPITVITEAHYKRT